MREFLEKYEDIKSGETREQDEIRVAVRVMAIRSAGASLRFYESQGDGTQIQIFCEAKNHDKAGSDDVEFAEHHNLFRRGDW